MTNANAVAVREMTDAQLDLLSRTIAKGCTPDELSLFAAQCRRTGLDPFSRQIHAVKRDGKLVIQTGIDGYRLIADRTGRYAGNDEPIYVEGPRGPTKATVTVWKLVHGQRCPFSASALWEEYYPGDKQGFMWKRMPHLMLAKVAEALALRKAFPHELSGVYTQDEIPADEVPALPAADVLASGPEAPPRPGKITKVQVGAIRRLADQLQMSPEDRMRLVGEYGVESLGQLTQTDGDAVIGYLQSLLIDRERQAVPREPGEDSPEER